MEYWKGLIDEVRLKGAVITDGQLQTQQINYTDPDGFYGMGAEDLATVANESPVAIPIITNTNAAFVDVDVLAACFNPGNCGVITISFVGTPTPSGAAAILNNKIRYTKVAGFVGKVFVTYSLLAMGKTSTSRLTFNIN
jgi:hypothetical protein